MRMVLAQQVSRKAVEGEVVSAGLCRRGYPSGGSGWLCLPQLTGR